MLSPVLFSSKSCEWATPQDFFDRVSREYGPFDLDVCATDANSKCDTYFAANALTQKWDGQRCWMNPPYGRGIGAWVAKAWESVFKGDTERVVCLLPARTDTAWFHDICLRYGKVEFIRRRLKFGGCENSAPFPSMLVIFGGQ